MRIERANIHSEESEQVMAELWREVDELYGNDPPSSPALTGMDTARAAFIVAREAGEVIGCGAIRPFTDEVAEVKRMFVRREARRAGVARAIMHVLEQIARENDFSAVCLETGLRQPAAIRSYESLGYRRIAGFGDYKGDPLSVCFGKSLI
ncbi:MAG: GNAT family N-acetyltransferase [Chthoniobacterales bacterium]|nr:GNAT family N-acetyltransferase [Chthoniobacterales bacterium]